MEYTLAGAAEVTGVAKTTIFRAIKSGKLSARRMDDKSFRIDASELVRVYPMHSSATHDGTIRNVPQQEEREKKPAVARASETEVAVLRVRLEDAESRLDREVAERERERQLRDQERETILERERTTVEDLRKRLDRSEERVLALSAPLAQPARQPAQERPVDVPTGSATKPSRGFLARLLGL